MYQKFIITADGHLRFGRVYLHRELLRDGEKCLYGGGLWEIDHGRNAVILYGRSFDFGPPDFDHVEVIEWDALGGNPRQLLHRPYMSDNDTLVPIYANRHFTL